MCACPDPWEPWAGNRPGPPGPRTDPELGGPWHLATPILLGPWIWQAGWRGVRGALGLGQAWLLAAEAAKRNVAKWAEWLDRNCS